MKKRKAKSIELERYQFRVKIESRELKIKRYRAYRRLGHLTWHNELRKHPDWFIPKKKRLMYYKVLNGSISMVLWESS